MRVFIVAGSPTAEPPVGLAPRPGDRVIAADGGAVHAAAWGWLVHLLVGDLDSAPPAVVEGLIAAGTPTFTAPAVKDETDLELALTCALADGATEIIVCAALGGRADHALANVLLLARPELVRVDVCIVEGRQTIRLLRGGTTNKTAQSILSGAPPLLGGAQSKDADTSPAAPASFDCVRHTPPDSAQDACAGIAKSTHLALTGAAGDLLSLLPIGGDAAGVTTAGLAYPLRDETLFFGQARGVSNVFAGKEAEVWLREGMLLVIQTQVSNE